MATLSNQKIEELLEPYLHAPLTSLPGNPLSTQAPLEDLLPALSVYLDLLLRWNERTNLTAIRSPEQIVSRHFGEGLFAARVLAARLPDGATVLDIGSGAGFPGLPIQLALPRCQVTLAESQGKKSAFLREAVRATGAGAEVWPARAQDLPSGRTFHAVTMRAVDRPEQALLETKKRLALGGYALHLCGSPRAGTQVIQMPGMDSGVIEITQS